MHVRVADHGCPVEKGRGGPTLDLAEVPVVAQPFQGIADGGVDRTVSAPSHRASRRERIEQHLTDAIPALSMRSATWPWSGCCTTTVALVPMADHVRVTRASASSPSIVLVIAPCPLR